MLPRFAGILSLTRRRFSRASRPPLKRAPAQSHPVTPKADTPQPRPPAGLWSRVKEFSSFAGGASYLRPRWLVLRAVGLIFIVIFSDIIGDARVLVGPRGLLPLSWLFTQHQQAHPGFVAAFLRAPGLFWLGTGYGMIATVSWLGLIAAVALALNLWPRLALFACWLVLFSFVSLWGVFSGSQLDQLMLETALLCIPFAPAGLRPRLGATSPPHPLAVFTVRWLLFRIMFEAGLAKILSGEPRWRDLTAMDVLYETSPLPTILGYHLHQLPHAFHIMEIAVTFAAEFVAPLLAVFGGRRGRWLAFAIWTAFQIGIQLTNNFGWLNTASIALGLLLLDDQMLATAAGKFRLGSLARFFSGSATLTPAHASASTPWRRCVLPAALGVHFLLTIHAYVAICGVTLPFVQAIRTVVEPLRCANAYTLYAALLPAHRGVEFLGSNDGGVTWRSYAYRYLPQREDRMSPFLAPRYARFEQTLQIELNRPLPSDLFKIVATHLLQRDAAVVALFAADPFPDRPPTLIRMPGYRFNFTDLNTHRQTGHYWRKTYEGEYQPMMGLNDRHEVESADSTIAQTRLLAVNGNVQAQNHLGLLNANGDGVPKNAAEAARWYRAAAEQGLVEAQFTLALMFTEGDGVARDEIEALVWFDLAARGGDSDAAKNRAIAQAHVGPAGVRLAQSRIEQVLALIKARAKPRP